MTADTYDPDTAVRQVFTNWADMPPAFRSFDSLVHSLADIAAPALPVPYHEHTCPNNACVYLGQFLQFDLYVCRVHSKVDLVVRYGDDISNVISGTAIKSHVALPVAFDRAQQRRLIHRGEVTTS